jgi:dihydrofolate synthase/folylpolyglutamate synthase
LNITPLAKQPPLETLAEWLAYLERIHPQSIAMGLERVLEVKRSLALDPDFPLITIAGTNGKGSTSAMLEAILHAGGYKVACYTSPHLERFNERVRINLAPAEDETLIQAFRRIERARRDTALTYFEFATLAAMLIFIQAKVDVAVLEVGLGGRLDAVNAFDTNCAVITSIAMDHMDYLGDDREKIGFEKAGILRSGRPAICAEPEVPLSIINHAAAIGADLQRIGVDFRFVAEDKQWRYESRRITRSGLPYPSLRGVHQLRNASATLAALDELRESLPLTSNDLRTGLVEVELPGRFQLLTGKPTVILDVAHNPHAAVNLAANLRVMPRVGRTLAVFAMLGDKDIHGVIGEVKHEVDEWFIAGISERRGAAVDRIEAELDSHGLTGTQCSSVAQAFEAARRRARDNDRILVFGSFHTVGDVLRHLHTTAQ